MTTNSKQKAVFIVCGATSGFGSGVARKLIAAGKNILAIARDPQKLKALQQEHPDHVEYLSGDLTRLAFHEEIEENLKGRFLSGMFLNSAGPPAKSIEETDLEDWDQAYQTLLRWKVALTKRLLPLMKQQQYGRILFLESSSVKQPIENLVLSTSLRLAVVGYAKTLSEEAGHHGITSNVLAPGYHDTRALSRLYEKKSQDLNISLEEARKSLEEQTKVGAIGNPHHLGGIAAWLLSEEAGYITGQTISVDGGVIKGVFG